MAEDKECSKCMEHIRELSQELEKHLYDHTHIEKAHELKYSQLLDAINELTKSTQGIVDAWKVADGLSRFGKWMSGFAGFGVLLAVITFVLKHI